MAQIILEPGEEFEHYHADKSTTTLLQGKVSLVYDTAIVELTLGEQVFIPPNTPHKMCNIGARRAVVECFHKPD